MTNHRNRSRHIPLVLIALLSWAVCPVTAAQTGDSRVIKEKRPLAKALTVQGPLTIYGLDFEGGGHTNQINLAGKELFEEPGFETVFIAASYPEKGPARVLMLELNSGGTACPSYYKVVEIKDDGSAVRSDKFGNCSPLAKSSFTQGAIHIHIPKFGGAAAQNWLYQNGKMEKATTSQRTRTK